MDEPGADLAVALAVASAARGVAPARGERPVAAFGEVGLTKAVRHVAHPERRRAEARRFGLEPVLGPGAETPTLRAAVQRALVGVTHRAACGPGPLAHQEPKPRWKLRTNLVHWRRRKAVPEPKI